MAMVWQCCECMLWYEDVTHNWCKVHVICNVINKFYQLKTIYLLPILLQCSLVSMLMMNGIYVYG